MADKYLMEGHKLKWHADRVNAWLRGERIAPIHIDVGISKGCNVKCHYCFGALQGNKYTDGKGVYFPREPLLNYMRSAGEVGVRSLAIIGEAEPTINPAMNEAIVTGAESGVDMSLATNGILFKPDREVLKSLVWLRFNISAASAGAYKKIHGSEEFEKAVESISKSVDIKRREGLSTTIGMQMVLTPFDVDEAVPLAKLGRELGVDYFVIKQCSDTLESKLGVYDKLEECRAKYEVALREAVKFGSERYDVIPKWKKIMETKQEYEQCLGVPFLLYSSGDGKLFPCGMFFNEEHWKDFQMGDLTKQSFKEIVQSERYWEVVKRVKDMGTGKCYAGCRTHAVNTFLWNVKDSSGLEDPKSEPPPHKNFI